MNNRNIQILITISFLLISNFAIGQIQIGNDIDGEANEDRSGTSVSMPDVNTLAIGAPTNNNGNGFDAGHVRIYSLTGNSWTQKGIDIDGEAAGDQSGTSVSMPDSNTVAIGAYSNDDNGIDAGHVRIYNWNGSAWIQKGSDIDGEAAGDQSGRSISMPDSNTIAIGARNNDGNGSDAGQVRIYSWNGSSWVQKGTDIDGEAAGDQSGRSVSMPNSNTVAIGAPYNDGNGTFSGHVSIYHWNGSAWLQKGIDIDGEAAADQSGTSVSMPDSNTIAIGAHYNADNGIDAGHVRIYTWDGTTWLQKGMDIDGDAEYDNLHIVSMPNSNTVAVGAPGNGPGPIDVPNRGHVRVYNWNGSAWAQTGSDIEGEDENDASGVSISMPDSITVAIGASWNEATGPISGHVRVYELSPISGILENDFGRLITLFPNPTNGNITIDLGDLHNQITVIVRNYLGQEVNRSLFTNISTLPLEILGETGVHFVEISSNQKKIVLSAVKK